MSLFKVSINENMEKQSMEISFINGRLNQSRNEPEQGHTNPGTVHVGIKTWIQGCER